MKILAIIPARGGSKGIPRKNIKLMNDKPLISYAISNALNSKFITDVVVSTDDDEIEYISKIYGAKVIRRPEELANDTATLDPVIFHAFKTLEEEKGETFDIIVTLQPTSPLLKVETLDKALESFINSDCDTYISVKNSPHLSWSVKDNEIVPNYKERVNRQQLPPYYVETGAFFFSRRNIVTPNSRIGGKISVYEVPEEEAIDIDSVSDWIICEMRKKKKKIVLRCDGYKKIGMGHVYHSISLAHNLMCHDVTIVTNRNYTEGLEKIKSSNLKYYEINNDEEFFEYLKNNKVDVVVNDCLDTTKEYILKLKEYVKKVVTIEDLGEGSNYADIVINALYDSKDNHIYSGPEYVCLREEFLVTKPKPIQNTVKNVVILFGGTDPSNLAFKTYEIINKPKYSNIDFNFITGIGSSFSEPETSNIKILNNVKNVAEYMSNADIAFTSQGRTVYELASLGVPSIVMAQNEREMLHTFASKENGFANLGLGNNVSKEIIENVFDQVIASYELRKKMNELMLRNDLRSGTNNEVFLITK